MSAATECTLTVAIADLQRAITSVAPHADKQKQGDEQSILCRVRLTAGKDHLTVAAADGRTYAVAWVPILSDSRGKKYRATDGPLVVDLYPRHARQLASTCTPITKDGEATGDATLTITQHLVTIDDKSGKYPDTSATVPAIEQEATGTLDGTDAYGYPDVSARVGDAFGRAAGRYKAMRPPHGALSRFETAAREYAARPVFEPVGDAEETAWLVWLRGEPFAGLFVQAAEDDQEIRRRASERLQHLRRLGLLSVEDEARLQLGGDLEPEGEQED